MSALLGIRGTPAFFLNQQLFVGAQPFAAFEAAIESELGKLEKQGPQKSSVVKPQPPRATAFLAP